MAEGVVIGRLLCLVGLHEWWGRSTFPTPQGEGAIWTSPPGSSDRSRAYVRRRPDLLKQLTHVCGRCPAKRFSR